MNLSKRNRSRRALAPARTLVSVLFLVLLSEPAWAYLDPGTGSMIISAIVGLFATVGLAVKTYWYKLKGFFRGSSREDAAERNSTATVENEQDAEATRSNET